MKHKKVNFKWIILALLAFLILVAALSFILPRSKEKSSLLEATVTAAPNLPPQFYDNFYQNDKQWADDLLAPSDDTMAQSGCLTSCIAASLAAQEFLDQTPGQLNSLLSTNSVYNQKGAIVWKQLSSAIPGISCQLDADISSPSINTLMESGLYPIVKVRRKSGAFHWVVLMEANAADHSFICLDPLDGKVNLDEYENRIYAVRVVSAQ